MANLWTYTQNFDSLNTGDLNGQDSWSANASIDVQTSVYSQGSKALSWPNNLDIFAARAITSVENGRIHVSLRSTANNVNGPWFTLKDDTNYLCIIQLRDDGQISMFTGASIFDLGAYSANTWYDVIIDFDCSTDQYRVSIDNGSSYSDWKVFWGTAVSSGITTIGIGSNTTSSSGTGYADDIRPFDITSISTSISSSLSYSISTSISSSLSTSISGSPSISPSSSISSSVSASPSAGYQVYTKGDYVSLPANNNDLTNAYTAQEITDVATKNDVRVSQEGTGYVIHQFKDFVGNAVNVNLEWEGQTNEAPSVSPVLLQIYNHSTDEWDTVDTDNSSAANTDFTLTGTVNSTDYQDESSVISCRVYQQLA